MVLALALVHQRSTNTFPTWDLAHPFRMIAHNGEINTLRGQRQLDGRAASRWPRRSFGTTLAKIWPADPRGAVRLGVFLTTRLNCWSPAVTDGARDDDAHPRGVVGQPLMDPDRRAFYEYHAALMEPWTGRPPSLSPTAPDRSHAGPQRPAPGARYLVTDDDLVVMGSRWACCRSGTQDHQEAALQPGKMFLIDMEQGRIIDDEELKASLATAKPYQDWL